ncbi:MAG: hypothetical protein KatS3mg131_1287 [Candidatus Tectimicrobiota bacterium]|nr:MAG: hypothetical protein KatS3mg131_1287 [Candidatus Tectomicrobia bacterium]
MGWLLLALWGIVLLGSPALGQAPAMTITVQRATVVEGPEITLGDLARIEGPAPLVDALRRVVIAPAPPAGEERLLYGTAVRTRLLQEGFEPDRFHLEVPEELRVERAAQHIDVRTLERVVREALRRRLPWPAERSTVRDIRGLRALRVPRGPLQYRVLFSPQADFLGPTAFSLHVLVAGNVEKRLHGTAYIEVQQRLVTLRRPLARGEIIQAEDLQLMPVRLHHLPRRVLTRPEDAIGMRARRPLAANTPPARHRPRAAAAGAERRPGAYQSRKLPCCASPPWGKPWKAASRERPFACATAPRDGKSAPWW